MKIKTKGVFTFVGSVIMACAVFLAVPTTAYGVEDPHVGTADSGIENMIAVGKTLIGKTPYVYGGGHSDWSKQKDLDEPTGLDCSSFVAWVLYRGMGVDMGIAPVSGSFPTYFETVNTGTLEGAKRGDIISDSQHIEIYLGEDESGKPISLHAANERQDVTITETNWGGGMEGKTVIRPSVEDAKSGKNGMSYKESAILNVTGDAGSDDSSDEEGTSVDKGSDEDLFSWLNPIVDFTGSSDSHAKSPVDNKRIDGNNKGLKGNNKGVFDAIFGGM